jgi:hypothetical protein
MKSDKTTVRQRVEEVLQLRLVGAEFADVRQHASAAEWNVSTRQLRRYIAHGDKILAATLEKDRDKLINRHIAQRRALYARAMSVSDYGTARAVLKDEAELLGLYPGKKMELTGNAGGPLVLNIVEEVIGHEPGKVLNVEEEIVTNGNGNRGASIPEDPPAPDTASVPKK